MNLGSAGEDGGRSQSDDGPEHPRVAENGDLSMMPGISFTFNAELYKGADNSTSSKPFQVLKINGRLVIEVSVSQFAFWLNRLTTNADNSWSI